MINIIRFLSILALILAAAPAGLNAFAQDELDSGFFRGVPRISIGEIEVNDPTLIRNPLEVSATWKIDKGDALVIFGYDAKLVVRLKDGRTFQESKSVGATETQIKFAVSIPVTTASRGGTSATSAPSGGAAASAGRQQNQGSTAASAQRSGASAASSGNRAGTDARRTAAGDRTDARRAAAGDVGRIVPQIAVESVSVEVIARYSFPFVERESRQRSFKF